MRRIIKTLRLATLAALASVGFWSCSDDGIIDETAASANKKDNKVEVKFNLGGEITASVGAMTRADAGNDLYAIFVENASTGDIEAYGVFDGNNLGNMAIVLDQGETYNFKAGMIRDARNKIYHKSITRYENGQDVDDILYFYPYYSQESDFNKFTYKENGYLLYGNPYFSVSLMNDSSPEESLYEVSPVDLYYGEEKGYTPVEGGTFTINMLRMVFQLAISVANLEEGETLTVSGLGYPGYNIIMTSEKPYIGDDESEGEIFNLPITDSRYNDEMNGTTGQGFGFSLIWKNSNGEEKALNSNIKNFGMYFERLKKYEITIDLADAEATEESSTVSYNVKDLTSTVEIPLKP